MHSCILPSIYPSFHPHPFIHTSINSCIHTSPEMFSYLISCSHVLCRCFIDVHILHLFVSFAVFCLSFSRHIFLLYLIFQPFLSPPIIIMTPSHLVSDRPQDAIAYWLEEQNETSFKFCYTETKIFDGLHQNIKMVSELLTAVPL